MAKSHKCLAFKCRKLVVKVPFCNQHFFGLPSETRAKITALWKAEGIESDRYKGALRSAILWHAMRFNAPMSIEDAFNLATKRVQEYVKHELRTMAVGSPDTNSLPDHAGQNTSPRCDSQSETR